jgi:catechol 2,3-dioxygenase-like lactoylglutathione lyase family enzyme
MKFQRMGHAAIHVSDLERSIQFYRDVLGMESVWTGDDDWANLKKGPDDLSLVRRAGFKHPPHLGFRVETRKDLEEAHAELKEKGIKVQAIREHRDQSVSFYFCDPDGNFLEALWEPQK